MFSPRAPNMRPLFKNEDHKDWYLSSMSNENNVKVMFMASASAWNEGLNVYMPASLSDTASPQSNVLCTDQSSLAYFDVNENRELVTHTYTGRVMQRCLGQGFIPIIIILGSPFDNHYRDENKRH
ncbi:hypothetical protein CH63R_14629 [Colletotrichum higginsianum IMI 349063]|uniref:Uncharacterized protein n=1 Tax=Colletotrichum higginsianum (strain IMI 349063) TaxID=759273 RepID=A0A1B7XQM0_COLHI|nr:hypothetical protein CH63R_14629 [Colletotrichum higginsianum IMI 349063]OBR02057.1 hypothetical protein CH63R_14629 [Colletotrichum higginsianum IMI 349063]